MKDYPFDRYKFWSDDKYIVIARSTHNGKTYIGKAKCDAEDEFNLEFGKKLAAARCNLKVVEQRLRDKQNKLNTINALLDALHEEKEVVAEKFLEEAKRYKHAIDDLETLLK